MIREVKISNLRVFLDNTNSNRPFDIFFGCKEKIRGIVSCRGFFIVPICRTGQGSDP